MYSYIDIHNFTPKVNYLPLDKLIPIVEQTMHDQNVVSVIGDSNFIIFKDKVMKCMEVYYKLVGIDDKVIEGKGAVEPKGVLPRYTQGLIWYFKELERRVPSSNEFTVLEYSGVDTIKIRYKYIDSVVKKLVKLGLYNQKLFDKPLQIFLKGGALHDLIGMQFVCSYPYEKEWVARTLYNFFEYDNRTDDHLIYGFYTVEKKSGYRGLHCDHTLFNPRFDADILEKKSISAIELDDILSLINSKDENVDILRKLKKYFNIELQLHTTFESIWSSMEHSNNYNIQAKGLGRNSKITVQWKMLSDAMRNLENQFERLQIDTEQARFEVSHHGGYIPIKVLLDELGSDTHAIHAASVKKVEDLEDDLKNHEISRQDYVSGLQAEADYIYNFALKENNFSVQIIFKMHSAFIYYGLANQSKYFNIEDIREFVKKALNSYSDISKVLSTHPEVHRGNLINIVAIFRYLYFGQKYGLGLINPPSEIFQNDNIPAVSYAENLSFFEIGISILNRLEDKESAYLKKDSANVIKIIHHYDVQAIEWELFNKESDSEKSADMVDNIKKFRKIYINKSLQKNFTILLDSGMIKNIGFVVNFYTTLVWHGFIQPKDAIKEIIKYSAYDKIKASDLFYYELSAYRFLVILCCKTIEDCNKNIINDESDLLRVEHYKNYHIKNMIQLLFRIRKGESAYKFYKAKLYFEQLTQTKFKIDHFSDMVRKDNKV